VVNFQTVVARISRSRKTPRLLLSQRVLLPAQPPEGKPPEAAPPDGRPFESLYLNPSTGGSGEGRFYTGFY
jgi:hypothetical protein